MQRRFAGCAAVLVFGFAAGGANAAEVKVRAPDGCVDASQLAEQVGVVLGRPLASVADVDFTVDIEPAPRQGWKLRLTAVGKHDGGQTVPAGSRELTARTCPELADAAAVAIAMSVRALKPDDNPEAKPPPPPSPPAAEASHPAEAVIVVAPAGAPARADHRIGVGLTAMALADEGALPGAGIGVELGGVLRISSFRIVARGALFASQEKRLASGSGGEFTLGFGTLLACLQRELGRPTLFGCSGFELGRLSGEGVGVSQPRLGSTTWEALTVEVGVAVPLSGPVAAVARGGAAAPLQRPEFVIGPTDRVHRAASLDGRFALGLEYFF